LHLVVRLALPLPHAAQSKHHCCVQSLKGPQVLLLILPKDVSHSEPATVDLASTLQMASMLEGGGKTPILEPALLQAMGFKLCAYPLSLLGVSIRAMEGALQGLKAGVVPAPPAMPTFPQLQAAVGFPEYFQEEARYAVPPAGCSGTASTSGTGHGSSDATDGAGSSGVEATSAAAAVSEAAAAAPPAAAPQESAGIEPDAVLEPDGGSSSSGSSGSSSQDAADAAAGSTINLYQSQGEGGEGQGGYRARNPSNSPQWLRVRITDTRADKVTLDTRIPAGGPCRCLRARLH
jgi:hypothetical protein